MKKLVLSVILAMAVMPVFAQFKVKGLVTDSVKKGEPYATLRVYAVEDMTKAVKLGTTEVDGAFALPLDKAGKYELTVTSVGKNPVKKEFELTKANPVADLGTMIVSMAANMLGEIEVVAQRPLVKAEMDKISYDVQDDEDSKTNTILEMLRKVPLVTVDGQDQIKVNGSINFKIYKNGHLNNSFSNNPKEVLGSIPASMIKRIEVITEPGAKYDAEGVAGILNIVMNDTGTLNGVLGRVGLNASHNGRMAPNIYLTTQVKKLTMSFNYGYTRLSKKATESWSESEMTYKNSGNIARSNEERSNPGQKQTCSVDASYEIDSLNLVTLSLDGYFHKVDFAGTGTNGMYARDGSMIYYYDVLYNTQIGQQFDFNGRLDYQHLTHRKDESIGFSYLLSTIREKIEHHFSYENMINMPVSYDSDFGNSNQKFMEHTFQIDWTRPFNEHSKMDVGAKYILRKNDSNYVNEYNDGTSNYSDFAHTTQVAAMYAEYIYSLKNWSVRGGLRYEYSYLSAKYKDGSNPDFDKNLSDLVPTASANYEINDANSLGFNYSMRINRPGIMYLNPAINATPTEVSFGNSEISSVNNHSVTLTYSFIKPKIMINASTGYTFASNLIAPFNYLDGNIIYYTYKNFGKTYNWNASAYVQWRMSKSTSLIFNGRVYHTGYKNKDLGFENNRWGTHCFAQLTHKLPWKLRLGISIYVDEAGADDVYSYTGSDMGHLFTLNRSFLKDDRLTVQLIALNPFSSIGSKKTYTVNGDYTGLRKLEYSRSGFSISVSYRFGKLKASVKKTNKTIENDDLVGRTKEEI